MNDFFFKKWLFPITTIFIVVYGAIWSFADPLGLDPGIPLLVKLFVASFIITTIYVLSRNLYETKVKLNAKEKQVRELHENLENALRNQSFCCVVQQNEPKCPVGIKSIHSRMKETLTSSIMEARKSFKWFGLSAFNVLHNNKELFAKRKDIHFEFVIANPENELLARENDKYYGDTKGRLNSQSLIKHSDELLKEIRENVNENIMIRYHNQIPTFRLILIDDRKVFVSFYERGKDALDTIQLEIEDDKAAKSIITWFEAFYEKSLITETIIRPKKLTNEQ